MMDRCIQGLEQKRSFLLFFKLMESCDVGKRKWTLVENVEVNGRAVSTEIPSCSVGFAYLWKSAPVLGTEALPIYAANEFKLPAAPWKWEVVIQFPMK